MNFDLTKLKIKKYVLNTDLKKSLKILKIQNEKCSLTNM